MEQLSGNYRIPIGLVGCSEEIKKSRFLTYVGPVAGKAAMREWLTSLRNEHPAARHHCWACVAGHPLDGQSYGFSDDGEPSGTAGKPLLNLLLGCGLGKLASWLCVIMAESNWVPVVWFAPIATVLRSY